MLIWEGVGDGLVWQAVILIRVMRGFYQAKQHQLIVVDPIDHFSEKDRCHKICVTVCFHQLPLTSVFLSSLSHPDSACLSLKKWRIFLQAVCTVYRCWSDLLITIQLWTKRRSNKREKMIEEDPHPPPTPLCVCVCSSWCVIHSHFVRYRGMQGRVQYITHINWTVAWQRKTAVGEHKTCELCEAGGEKEFELSLHVAPFFLSFSFRHSSIFSPERRNYNYWMQWWWF